MKRIIPVLLLAAGAALAISHAVGAQTITEPTRQQGLAGYDQPNQYLASRTVKLADNM
jgi:arylsulfatase